MKKKIISVVAAAAMMLSGFSAYGAAIPKPENAMRILSTLGVISGDPDGNLRPDDSVTRAEFAKLAVLLSGYRDQVGSGAGVSVFADCTAEHWASGYVKTAAQNGLIQGYSNGLFGPDDRVTYAQAVTIALRLLGYEDADFGFSYPEGQLGMAISLKLNSNLNKSADEYMTRREVSVLLANTLTVPGKGSSSDYIQSLGYRILENCIVVADSHSSPAVREGKVYTSLGEYSAGDSFDSSLVGKKGDAIVSSDGKLLTLLDGGLTVREYCVYSVSANDGSIVAYNEDGFKTLRCDSTTVCYKGTSATTFSGLLQNVSTGSELIVATDSNDVTDYIIAGESDLEGPYIASADGALPFDVGEAVISVTRNGVKCTGADIRKNDVLYYSDSLSAVFAYSRKVSGLYEGAVPNTDSPKSVTVGGVSYAIESPGAFAKLCSLGDYKPGDHLVILLGIDGGIADVMDGNYEFAEAEASPAYGGGEYTGKESALLSALGSVSASGDSLSADAVTRGEFAKAAVMISTYSSNVSLGSRVSIFPDCTYDYPYTPYIKVAVEKGLMSAYSDSLFRPDSPISLAEAADSCLRILGYTADDFANAWPYGQMSAARSAGILDGIGKDAYDAITRDEAMLLLYNTFCADLKSGLMTAAQAAGYEYYDDTVIIATNRETSSIGSGKVLTSVGSFVIDEGSFDYSTTGCSGQLLVKSGRVQMFNRERQTYSDSIIYSALSDGMAVWNDGGIAGIPLSDSITAYADDTVGTYGAFRASLRMGDSVRIYYNAVGGVDYLFFRTTDDDDGYVAQVSGISAVRALGASDGASVMRNGTSVSADEIAVGDVMYYSQALDTVFAYDDKVVGIFESASPSKDRPDSVTVSGTTYMLEGNSAAEYLATCNYGDTVVLSLGRDGRAANAYSAADSRFVGYLSATGVKEFKNTVGDTYTSVYARLVLPDGTEIECATDTDYDSWINRIMSVSFESGKAVLKSVSPPGTVSGKVNASDYTIGSLKVSRDVNILDIGNTMLNYPSIYANVFLQRIDGLTLDKNDVLACTVTDGVITELILDDVTGDAFSYGVITRANVPEFGTNGSYTCDVKGNSYSYNGGIYNNVSRGSFVKTALSGTGADMFNPMTRKFVTVTNVDYMTLTTSGGDVYKLYDDVTVYRLTGTSTYTLLPLSELVDNLDNYSYFSVYTDKAEKSGGRVRVITVKEK